MTTPSGGKKPPATLSAWLLDTQMVTATCAGLLYMAISIGMIFINKATMLVYNMPMTLLFLQMTSVLIIVRVLIAASVVYFPSFTTSKAIHLLPVTLLYTANVGFGLMAVAALNVPVRSFDLVCLWCWERLWETQMYTILLCTVGLCWESIHILPPLPAQMYNALKRLTPVCILATKARV